MKRVVLISGIVAFLFLFYVLYQVPDKYVHLIFCDVGQGDALLITKGYKQILVDGGPDLSVMECLSTHMPFWDKKIEVVVATHPDADHIGGLTSVFKEYESNLIITNQDFKQTTEFDDFKKAISRKDPQKTKHFFMSQNMELDIDKQLQLISLFPQAIGSQSSSESGHITESTLWDRNSTKEEKDKNYNNGSITLFLRYNAITALLMGDLEKEGEEALLQAGLIAKVDVLKVGHHGSKSSSVPEFISKSRPEISIISSGKNNKYGHPSREVMDRVAEVSRFIWRTDTEGTIELITDGKKIWKK